MSCTPPVRTVTVAQRQLAFSSAAASPGSNFIPLSPEDFESLAPLLKAFRATLTAESCTDKLKVQCAWQTSDNGVSWGVGGTENASSPFGSTLTSPGLGPKTTTTAWVTDLSGVQRFIRWGVVATQDNVNTLQQGLVTLTLDLESRS